MALSEIEKLERRYAENPQGLTFAPLAEVHRKNGEVRRAIDLLGPGLEIHPDYIPASIVLGRCHMDLGDVHAAEKAFLHVLALDGENVIALKALADISERLLKFDEAERWLQTLLSVDRSNDGAREQLQRVEVSRRQAEVGSSVEPSSVVEPPSVVEAPADIAPPPQPFEPPVAEPALGWVSQSSQAEKASPMPMEDLEPEAARPEDLVPVEDSVEPIEGLVGREVDIREESLDDFRVETAEDIVLESAGGSEFQVPDASQELFASDAHPERAPFEEDALVAPSAAWDAPPAERTEPEVAEPEKAPDESLRAEAYSSPEPTAPEPAASKPHAPEAYAPEPYVQEPPAPETFTYEPTAPEPPAPEPAASEPYAPEPYEPEPYEPEPYAYEPPAPEPPAPAPEPVAPEPIVASASAPGDYRYLRRDEDREEAQPPAAPPKRSYSVGETGGRSVTHLFKGILSARPPSQASAAPVRQAPAAGSAGAPTRPAADALSLSSVFGEEASETPPAVPASSQGAGSVSFDDFFTSPSASPAARTARAPDPKNDDLDQFHAWLQNLKR
jgi:tetratricopeptide (TPR) repeat protein